MKNKIKEKIKYIIAWLRIPRGIYCYKSKNRNIYRYDYIFVNGIPKKIIRQTKLCPYWVNNTSQPYQMNGYCRYLKLGDWEDKGTTHLWDQVKECGIKERTREDRQYEKEIYKRDKRFAKQNRLYITDCSGIQCISCETKFPSTYVFFKYTSQSHNGECFFKCKCGVKVKITIEILKLLRSPKGQVDKAKETIKCPYCSSISSLHSEETKSVYNNKKCIKCTSCQGDIFKKSLK